MSSFSLTLKTSVRFPVETALEGSADFRLLPAELGKEALLDTARPGVSFSKKLTDCFRSSCSRLAEALGPATSLDLGGGCS